MKSTLILILLVFASGAQARQKMAQEDLLMATAK